MANTRGKDAPKVDDAQDKQQVQEPETVRLRYLGPSHEFIDTPTGVTFVRDGQAQELSVEDAARLQRQPHETFDRE